MKNLPQESPGRWTLIRDALIFQVKLIVDGLRDLLLVPASAVAALLSLLSGSGGQPGPYFYRLVGFGKRTEQWIDLFAAHQNAPEGIVEAGRDSSIDDLVHRVEAFVVDEYQRGGVTRQAKEHIDKALDTVLDQLHKNR